MYGLLSGLREYFTRIMKWRSRGEILVNNYLQYLFSWNEFAKIFKFASIKHILNNHQNDQNKMFELLEEVSRDLKNYDLEFRIEELESKFSKDLSESTFNEIRELKKQKNIN